MTVKGFQHAVSDQLQSQFTMRPLGYREINVGRIFAGFLKDLCLLFFRDDSIATRSGQIGKQTNDLLVQNMLFNTSNLE
ncbi:MAG: hypothetical protein AAGJ40_19655 [Planctomycetota bacterium]